MNPHVKHRLSQLQQVWLCRQSARLGTVAEVPSVKAPSEGDHSTSMGIHLTGAREPRRRMSRLKHVKQMNIPKGMKTNIKMLWMFLCRSYSQQRIFLLSLWPAFFSYRPISLISRKVPSAQPKAKALSEPARVKLVSTGRSNFCPHLFRVHFKWLISCLRVDNDSWLMALPIINHLAAYEPATITISNQLLVSTSLLTTMNWIINYYRPLSTNNQLVNHN